MQFKIICSACSESNGQNRTSRKQSWCLVMLLNLALGKRSAPHWCQVNKQSSLMWTSSFIHNECSYMSQQWDKILHDYVFITRHLLLPKDTSLGCTASHLLVLSAALYRNHNSHSNLQRQTRNKNIFLLPPSHFYKQWAAKTNDGQWTQLQSLSRWPDANQTIQ